jgi:hypothetical protein
MVLWGSPEGYNALMDCSSAASCVVASSDWASFFPNAVSCYSNFVFISGSDLMWVGLSKRVRMSSIYLACVYATCSIFCCMVLIYEFTAVVIAAIFSVVMSSKIFNLISRPSVVRSKHPVISYNILSICEMCFLVRCIVESLAIMWDRLILTAVAISWFLVANTHNDALISSAVFSNVTM